MKKGSVVVRIYLSCALLLIPTAYSPADVNGKFHTFLQKARGVIKDWVYKGWVRKDNFYEIIPGELYRSSQLPPSRLEAFIKQYGVKTIVNLSGDEPYYWVSSHEKQLADKHEIILFNIKTYASIVTPLDKVRTLLTISLCAPLPILFHCFAGSDRTGEACALYMLANDKGIQYALSQLSPRYGHKKWLYPFKYFLITNIEKVYPNLLDNLRQVCDCRFSYDELKDIPADDLYFKISEGTVGKGGKNSTLANATDNESEEEDKFIED